jgi:hypothetical protein
MFPAQVIITSGVNNLCRLKKYHEEFSQFCTNPTKNYFESVELILPKYELSNPHLIIFFGDK